MQKVSKNLNKVKIFYGFAVSAHKDMGVYFQKIVKTLQNISDVSITRDWYESALISRANSESKFHYPSVYNQIRLAIKNSDACIFEVSVPSTTLGGQISLANELSIPILLAHKETAEFKKSVFAGIESEHVKIVSYNSESELEKLVKDFVGNLNESYSEESQPSDLIVQYCFSTDNLLEQFNKYQAIVGDLRNTSNVSICYDWIDISIKDRKENKWRDNESFFQRLFSSIKQSDIVIFELTTASTNIGMQLSQALSSGKPILALIDKTRTTFERMYINKLTNPNLQVAPYGTAEELRDHIQKFIKKHRKTQKSRFSVWLPKGLADGMKKYERETDRSREDILREYLDTTSL